MRWRGEEVRPLMHLSNAVTVTCQSNGAFLTKVQLLSIDLSEVGGLLVLVVLAMLLEERFGGRRGLCPQSVDGGLP